VDYWVEEQRKCVNSTEKYGEETNNQADDTCDKAKVELAD